jgi:CheY-like chemotaxis protein
MKLPEKIIVVDDDSINNMFCRYIINEALDNKVEVVMFAIPRKALEYIKNEYFLNPVQTLMFLDINMPVLSGWDVLSELEKSELDISGYIEIYILSSSVDPKDKERAAGCGLVKGFLEKPLEVEIVQNICGAA